MNKKIPNIFHFVFGLKKQTEPFHLSHYLCIESCIQVNNPEKVFLYYHYEPFGHYWDLIKDKLELVKVDLVPAVSNFNYQDKFISNNFLYAHHSDFIRIEKLIEKGGIYADIDTLFVNPIPASLFEKTAVMGWEDSVYCHRTKKPQPSVCNALIMMEQGAEFGEKYLNQMSSELDGSWSNHSCFLAYKISEQNPDLVHLEPKRSFYKHPCTPEGLETLFRGLDEDFKDIYSIHMWSHLWWSRSRKDFSTFHAGKLTEKFIQTVDTTYNIVARKFLPESTSAFYRSSRSIIGYVSKTI